MSPVSKDLIGIFVLIILMDNIARDLEMYFLNKIKQKNSDLNPSISCVLQKVKIFGFELIFKISAVRGIGRKVEEIISLSAIMQEGLG